MSEFIFTRHARERLRFRRISEADATKVLRHPDKTFPGKKLGTIKFIRDLHDREIHLVATYVADQKKWLVVSAWVRGEDDTIPLGWQLITFPFKLSWWFLKKNI
jgi:hypothetical protein